MSIRIDQKKCVGCRKCSEVCPGTLIVMEDKKAVMKYPKNCWGCVSCVKECKAGAIDFFLGADIGGNGSIMNVKSEGDILHWIITKTDGSTSVIDVNRRNSNKPEDKRCRFWRPEQEDEIRYEWIITFG